MKAIAPKQTQAVYGQPMPQFQLWLDGASDLLKVWDLPPHPKDRSQYDRLRRVVGSRPEHFGCMSEAEARDVLTKGYPHGAKLVTDLAKQITDEMPPPKSRRRTRRWRDDGDELNHERVQTGHDNCWRSMHRQLKSACGLIELVCTWGEGCGGTLQQLQWSGAAALALTDLLEKADYSVELALIAAMSGYHTVGQSLVRVDLKRMGELVDLEQLAAVAVYPPAWRVYGLTAFQQSPFGSGDAVDSHPHDYFTSSNFEPQGMWNYRPNVMTVTLNPCHSEQAAKSACLDTLKQLESMVNPQDA